MMEDIEIEISPQYKATSVSVPSPSATHVACLSSSRLQIRCLTTFELVRSIALPSSLEARSSRLAWSPPSLSSHAASVSTPTKSRRTPRPASNRLLIFDENTTRVYDLRDEKWIAVINNGSGGMGKNAHVEFGADENEVLVWSDFGACAKVWSLKSGRTTEIRDPKFTGRDNKGWGYRPIGNEGGARNRVLALLCRTSGQDILLLLAPRTYAVINRVELPTIDAVGLKWSRDGRWIAIWDTPSAGYSLCIYTADGHLYRTIAREPTDDISEWAIEGLGIKSVEWVPGAEFLAVGGWDRRVRILSTRTFSPVVFLDHTAVIHVPSAPVYSEQVDAQGSRSYRFTSQPVTPPKAPVEKNETSLMKQGISILAFNKDGTYCATRDDSTPSTVWIWELRSLRPRTILIQHAPIKSLRWHHNDPSLLLIQTVQDSPTIYLYTASSLSASAQASSAPAQALPSPPPEILTLSSHIAKPTNSVLPRWTLSWLSTAADKKPAFTLAHQQGYIFAWPLGKDQILRFDDEDASGDESEDSLYDILTGRTPLPRLHNQRDDVKKEDDGGNEDDDDEDEEPGPDVDDSILAEQQLFAEEEQYSNLSFDDTFRGKAPLQARPRGLDDSGLDEMF